MAPGESCYLQNIDRQARGCVEAPVGSRIGIGEGHDRTRYQYRQAQKRNDEDINDQRSGRDLDTPYD